MIDLAQKSPIPLIQVNNLSVVFKPTDTRATPTTAVNNLSFQIYPKEIVAIVGESGSGKSVSARCLTNLWRKSDQVNISGSIIFNDQNLLALPQRKIRKIRGSKISYIFQEPSSAINPVFKIGYQLKEIYHHHRIENWKKRAIEQLQFVNIHHPEKCLNAYPSELSGGMLQRIAILLALIPQPDLIIADEPTTALDSTTQLKIIEMLKIIPQTTKTSICFITHDLGILKRFAHRILVMKSGRLIESGTTEEILNNPTAEYTQRLIASIPKIGSNLSRLPI